MNKFKPVFDPHGACARKVTSMYDGINVLLVEDQLLIAMDAEGILNDHGIQNVRTSTNLNHARETLAEFSPTIAILDINIGRETSLDFARHLASANIPFAFTSGYSRDLLHNSEFAAVPVINKPFGESELIDTIHKLLGSTKVAP